MQEIIEIVFSGIIVDIGVITQINSGVGDWKITIKTSIDTNEITIGDSISCDGICLTVIEISKDSFAVQASIETQNVTTLKFWKQGYEVNLERALSVGDLLNGHFVQGHVDSYTEVLKIEKSAKSWVIKLKTPKAFKKYIAYKGSIALNGVSITVNDINDTVFFVNIIPHTWENTTFSNMQVGSFVNFEVDLLARYLDRLRLEI
jgi:riboflavin synthase